MSVSQAVFGRQLVIRAVLRGCANRPFYHFIVQEARKDMFDWDAILEQVGSYDPMPNERGEKLVAFNYDRIKYWIGSGAIPSATVQKLLGLSGFYPVHPVSIIEARRNRLKMEKKKADQEAAAAAQSQE